MKAQNRIHARSAKSRGSGLWAIVGAGLLLCTLVLPWLGCTPEKRYKVLSFFFDGVPDPNAPPVTDQERDATGNVINAVAFVHKPYGEGKCDACHGNTAGKTFESFSRVDDSVCKKCHEPVYHEYPRMHGPVALGECSLCHVPHESSVQFLLKDLPTAVCSSCHLKELLPSSPIDHQSDRNCLDCHSGHGGTAPALLKTGWNATTLPSPATQPATIGGAR